MHSPDAYIHFTPHASALPWIADDLTINQAMAFKQPEFILQTAQADQVSNILNQSHALSLQNYTVIGFVSYEAYLAFTNQTLKYAYEHTKHPLIQAPLAYFMAFKNDTLTNLSNLSNLNKLQSKPINLFDLNKTWQMQNYVNYQANIECIRQAIIAGNTYQINYTQQLELQTQPNLRFSNYDLYHQLAKKQPSYSMYLNIPNFGEILSFSPELFFSWNYKKQQLFTQPMKGTASKTLNAQQAKAYLHTAKEMAENIMIVDLLRNDLAKISQQVYTTNLLEVIELPTLWQMVSSIYGQLKPHICLADIFSALFPCGSITGAPKLASINYINQLEKTPRGLYCGAMGYMANGSCIFNVAIRTLQYTNHTYYYGVGSGITIDSKADKEWQECQQKTAFLL